MTKSRLDSSSSMSSSHLPEFKLVHNNITSLNHEVSLIIVCDPLDL